jgi:pimeloyl-ACP methyl ester carboxylesterase
METGPAHAPLVLVLAGAGYGQQAPLLWWSTAIARQAGCEVLAPAWMLDDAARADPVGFVTRHVETALAGRRPDLVVAKSFGCSALPWALRAGVPGVWLTPVLTDDAVRDALAAVGVGHIAVGGSADPMWRPERAPHTRAQLVTVDGADHALEVPGDWRRSQRLQAEVLELVEREVRAL